MSAPDFITLQEAGDRWDIRQGDQKIGTIKLRNGRHIFTLKPRFRFQALIAAHCLAACRDLDQKLP